MNQRADEFPPAATRSPNEMERRDFLRLMGASAALAGFGACTKQPLEKIVPYVNQPPEITPGNPLYFASATSFCGYAQGLIATSREGRPIKLEGNPDHPASLGATTPWAQADLLDLYDPDRAKTVADGDKTATWSDFMQRLNAALAGLTSKGGAGLRVLTQTITSPTLGAQLRDFTKKFPAAQWHQWEPLTRDAPREARAGGVYGGETLYDLRRARVIVALDSDFLFLHPAALRHARDFAAARRVAAPSRATMSRLYVAEPTPTVTGSNADHRLPIQAREIQALATALAALTNAGSESAAVPDHATEWLWVAAQDLRANRGAGIVIAGETQPPHVHALVEQINAALGNLGSTISHSQPVGSNPVNQLQSLRTLTGEMRHGAVELLLILGGNPVYDAPVDLDFAGALEQVNLRIHHTLHPNETTGRCHWQLPATHFLESWSDLRAADGTVTIVQPLIEPLYAGISSHELLDAMLQQSGRSAYEIVRTTWKEVTGPADFETRWRQVLSDGFTPSPGGESKPAAPMPAARASQPAPAATHDIELTFRADPSVLDGRYANNGWLQELPRPFSKLTWGNAALISPRLAEREHLASGDLVELSFRGRKIEAPVWVMPGQAEQSVTLHLGYGRAVAGRVGTNIGCNVYPLRSSDALWHGDGLTVRKTGRREELATTQRHFSVEGRDLLRAGTLVEFVRQADFAQKPQEAPGRNETLYNPDEFSNPGYAWGMVIDLNTCIGCNSCTIACQAENNIPVVGQAQVLAGREMHWLRIDTYQSGRPNAPEFNHQPVPCMHCEHAPCELVCPVAATMHDNEGLNVQVYNRCVGTRYCSNNCPYKVRRFNFFEYNGALSPAEKLVKNPDVTVRSRGVMEKCTYCLQRISRARVAAELQQRTIRDGEVTPACAQVCPTEAIIFGNINDPDSRVSRLKRQPLNYSMLAGLNTRPRTSYLARLRNLSASLVP